ncbi:MAG: hypothetical protein ACRD1H_16575 [Vicinamibacterales bacterium]
MLIDFLHLFRTLRRSPASAVAAVLTLSLTLGVGASIFAVVDAVLLTPPPFANPEALYLVGGDPVDMVGFVPFPANPEAAAPATPPRTVSYATFETLREHPWESR